MRNQLEPPETTYYDRVSIVKHEHHVPVDDYNRMVERAKSSEDGAKQLRHFQASIANDASREFVAEMVEQDLILYRQFPSEGPMDHHFRLVLEAVMIDGNHQVMRDAHQMARDVIQELRSRRHINESCVDMVSLEAAIAEKIAEILHSEKAYDE